MISKQIYYLTICLLLTLGESQAGRCGPPINPVTDVNWQCIFPIRTGGVVEFSAGQRDPSNSTEDVTCTCMKGPVPYLGITVSYWEPFAIMDSVTDPWCFMPLATTISAGQPGRLGGTYSRTETGTLSFAQVHYYKFPVFNLLDMFTDLPCNDTEVEFDLAMMTEVVPTWNDEIMALVLDPEAVLFGNPATQIACSADVSSIVTRDKPLDQLFWCMGSWGSAYPIAGTSNNSDFIEANAAIAAKGIYMMARSSLLKDRAISVCGASYSPIWRKSHYKMQLMKPVRDSQCRVIGEPGLLWTHGKNRPYAGDNFSWLLFRKNRCCVGY